MRSPLIVNLDVLELESPPSSCVHFAPLIPLGQLSLCEKLPINLNFDAVMWKSFQLDRSQYVTVLVVR